MPIVIVHSVRPMEVTLSIQAKATTLHALCLSLSGQFNGLINRLLPSPGGIGEHSAKGKDSASVWAPSMLTVLSERAAQLNNEVKSATEFCHLV